MKKLIFRTCYTMFFACILTDVVLAFPDDYTEDLSHHRSIFSHSGTDLKTGCHLNYQSKNRKKKNLTTTYDITPKLEKLLLDIKAYNELTTVVEGYTIQSYNGTNRPKALQIKEELSQTCYPLMAEVKYKQPNFSVEIGLFLDLLEAYPLYFRIKKCFPQAIIRLISVPKTANIWALKEETEEETETLDHEVPPFNNSEEVGTTQKSVPLDDLEEYIPN